MIQPDILGNKNKYVPALALAAAALASTACSAETPGQNREGERNTAITSLSIDEGANIRETPIRGQGEGNNLAATLDMPAVYDAKDGVMTYEDRNGTWFGVPSDVMAEQVDDPAQKEAILDDKDGTVWVNDDRATPIYDTTK